jgi:hypothetical protein
MSIGHALHFDPDCEECAYLARPTRETLVPAEDEVARLVRAMRALRADIEAELALLPATPTKQFDLGAAAAYHHVLARLVPEPRP